MIYVYLMGSSRYSTDWAKSYFVNENFRLFSRLHFDDDTAKVSIWHFFTTVDSVHLFPFFSPYDLLPILILKLRRKKVFFGIHDFYLHPGERSLVVQLLIFFYYILANEVVVFSRGVHEDIRLSLVYKLFPKNIIETHLSINIKDIKLVQNVKAKTYSLSRLNLLFFGRIEAYKGLNQLVKAFMLVEEPNLYLTICGRGRIDSATMGIIKGATNISLYNDWVEDEVLDELISAADIICLPYNGATQSGVLFKAFEFGKPCIVTPDEHLLKQAQFGVWVCDGFDEFSISEKIKFILDNPNEISSKRRELMQARDNYAAEVLSKSLFEYLRKWIIQ